MPLEFIEEEFPHGFWIETFRGARLKVPRSLVCDLVYPDMRKDILFPEQKPQKKFQVVMRVDKLIARCTLMCGPDGADLEIWRTHLGPTSDTESVCHFTTRRESDYRVFHSFGRMNGHCLVCGARKEKKRKRVQSKTAPPDRGRKLRRPRIQKLHKPPLPPRPVFPMHGFTIKNFRGEPLHVTKHAVERLVVRWPKPEPITSMDEAMQQIEHLAQFASCADNSPHFALRIIDHEFKPTEYFNVSEELRFVVTTDREGGDRSLVTIEQRIESK